MTQITATLNGKPITGDLVVSGPVEFRATIPGSVDQPTPTPELPPLHNIFGMMSGNGRSVFLRLRDEDIRAADKVQWIADNGDEQCGWVSAWCVDPDGKRGVTLKINDEIIGRTTAIARPEAKSTRLTPGDSLHDLAPGTYQLAAGVYPITKDLVTKDVTLIGGKDVVVEWRGNARRGWPFWRTEQCTLKGITVRNVSYHYTAGDKVKGAIVHCFAPGNDSTFIGVTTIGFGYGWNLNGNPKRVLLDACEARDVLDYGVWVQGEEVVIVGMVVSDSIFEHCIRVSSPSDALTKLVTINRCHLVNLDKRPGDPNNDAKGTIVVQAGTMIYLSGNILNGPAGVGPLHLPDGDVSQFTRIVRVENETRTHALQLWPGLDDAVIVGGTVERMAPRGGDKRVIGKVVLQ